MTNKNIKKEGGGDEESFHFSFSSPLQTNDNTSAIVLIIDSEKETQIGLGHAFSQRILGQNECMVTDSALRYLGITPGAGQYVRMDINIVDLLKIFVPNFDSTQLTTAALQ